MVDYVAIANQYINDVLSKKISACKWVRLACKRQKKDLTRKRWPYHFDTNKANKVCRFIEALKHTKGPKAGECIHLEPWQCFILTTIFGWVDKSGNRRFRRVFIEVPRGNGKALDVNTLIPTPNGFVKMQDIKAGMQVFGSDGKPCNVIACTEVMYDRPSYKLTFSTNDSIIADANHEWVTDTRRDRYRLKGRNNNNYQPIPTIKTTKEISETVLCRGEHNHRIPVCRDIELPYRDLLIPPYVLGLWLGDGCTRTATFTCGSADVELISNIESYGYLVRKKKPKYQYCITSRTHKKNDCLQVQLRKIGVLGNKHIPADYLFASREQRLELLRGLMDTDGFISKGQGQCEFTQKSEVLARQVYQLITSLGYRATIHTKNATCNGKDCGVVYRIMFHAYSEEPVFKLKRKLERMKARPQQKGLQDYRQIISCEKIDSVPVKCIEVDSADHCYLAGESFIKTHNSEISSGVGLYMLCADGEIGADCYSFATTGDQARIVFNDACAMVQNNSALKDYFGIQVFKNSICIGSTNSKFQPKSSNSSTNDGLNTHFACIDELHAHKDRLLFEVVKTSMGKRKQSLMWSITTAGYNLQGVWMEERIKTQKMLEGLYSQDTRFGIIYTIDDGDDWKTEEALIKANPNWGISVNPIDVLDELKEAKINPTNEVEYQTKRLDLPCNSNTVWMPLTRWSKCYRDVKESEFDREYCIIGADLASKLDITALVRLYWRQEENPKTKALELHFYAFGDYFLPSDTVEQSSNANYRVWVNQGLMTTTEGAVIDLNQVQDKILEICQQKTVIAVAYDPFQATQLATNLLNEGCRMVEIGQTVKNLSEPMKFCKELVYQKRLHTDGSPILAWMVTNVIAHLDAKENIFPRKALPTDKIDGVLALLMCLNQVIHLDIENKYQNGDTISDNMLML